MSPSPPPVVRRACVALVSIATRHAVATLLAAVLITLAAAWYTATHLGIDTDTSNMLDPRLPHRQAARALDAAFPRLPGEVVVTVEAAGTGRAAALADTLAATLAARADIVHRLHQPGGGPWFARQALLYLEPDALWDLADRLAAAEPMLGVLAADPSLRGLLGALGGALDAGLDEAQADLLAALFTRLADAVDAVLADTTSPMRWQDELFTLEGAAGGRAVILIDPARVERSFRPADPAIDALKAVVTEFGAAHPEATIGVTGSAVMDGEELVTVAADAGVTTTLAFLCVGLVLAWGLRSVPLVAAVLFTLACGLVWTAAFATAWVGDLNIISVTFAVLFIGMGVDFGIQFALRYREEAGATQAVQEALLRAAAGAGSALVLATVGAAISFFAFVPTRYLGLAELGLISGASMGIALLANLTVLPACLALAKAPRHVPRPADSARWAAFIVARHRAILLASALLVLGSLALVPRAEFDLNPLNLKDPDSPGVRAFHALAADGAYTIDILAPSLAEATTRAARLAELPQVARALTLASFVPGGQEEKLDIIEGMRLASGALDAGVGLPAPDATQQVAAVQDFAARLAGATDGLAGTPLETPAARLAAALARLRATPDWQARLLPALDAALVGDLAPTLKRLRALLAASAAALTDLPADLRERYLAGDGRARIEVHPRANLNDNGAMREFVAAVQAVEPDATGAPVELVAGAGTVIAACTQAAGWALLLTLLMHIGVLGGLRDAVLVSLPLVLALLLTLATTVLAGLPFNFANIIALPLLIGLNNAYGAYLVMRRGGDDVTRLLATSTPRAVLFSGLTTIASFGTLAVSQHPGMAGMGVLITLSLGYALLSALLALPAAMVWLALRRRPA